MSDEARQLLVDLLVTLPECAHCIRPAIRSEPEDNIARFCDAHASSACPDVRRAPAVRAAMKWLVETEEVNDLAKLLALIELGKAMTSK